MPLSDLIYVVFLLCYMFVTALVEVVRFVARVDHISVL